MSKSLALQWTKGVSGEAKDQLELAVRHSTVALGRFKKMLEEKLVGLESQETKSDAYENPSWAYFQADLNGSKRAYKEMIALLSFLET